MSFYVERNHHHESRLSLVGAWSLPLNPLLWLSYIPFSLISSIPIRWPKNKPYSLPKSPWIVMFTMFFPRFSQVFSRLVPGFLAFFAVVSLFPCLVKHRRSWHDVATAHWLLADTPAAGLGGGFAGYTTYHSFVYCFVMFCIYIYK